MYVLFSEIKLHKYMVLKFIKLQADIYKATNTCNKQYLQLLNSQQIEKEQSHKIPLLSQNLFLHKH